MFSSVLKNFSLTGKKNCLDSKKILRQEKTFVFTSTKPYFSWHQRSFLIYPYPHCKPILMPVFFNFIFYWCLWSWRWLWFWLWASPNKTTDVHLFVELSSCSCRAGNTTSDLSMWDEDNWGQVGKGPTFLVALSNCVPFRTGPVNSGYSMRSATRKAANRKENINSLPSRRQPCNLASALICLVLGPLRRTILHSQTTTPYSATIWSSALFAG